MDLIINNINELPFLTERILKEFSSQRIFFFYGNLGAGKTTIIQHLCKSLGVNQPVTSPTFNIVQEYRTGKDTIYHMDLYRIKKEQELHEIGLEEYLDSGNYCFIEWPQMIESWALQHVKVEISVVENMKRRVNLQVV